MRAVPDHVALACVSDPRGAHRADDPINDAAALRALNPMFRTGQTVGAGHFNLLEVPDQVNAMIERFLLIALE